MIVEHAKIVIIGGGIIGASTAYHLAQLGEADCIVLEQGSVTNGSTWHAAGLVGQLRNNANVTQLLKYSVDLYRRLESETDQSTGWKMNGGLRLACNDDRVHEIKRQITMARSFGLEMHFLSPQEVAGICPMVKIEDLKGAAYLPTDGQVNPSDLTQSLLKGARKADVKVVENCKVEQIVSRNRRVKGVVTSQGTIECEFIVNCAGLWSQSVGMLSDVNIPIVPMKHHYVVTGKIKGIPPTMPTVRDPDRLIYFKEDVGGLVMGGYESNPQRWDTVAPVNNFGFSLLEFDLDHFEPLLKAGIERIPALENVPIKEMICGPESFTPDGNFILGEAPQLKNYFVGTGFNAFGIASAGGAGRALAEWLVGGAPSMDLGVVDIRRFGKVHYHQTWVQRRTVEICSKHYTMAWPHEEHASVRGHFRSVLYDELRTAGACFGEKLGWERANWFAEPGEDPVDRYSYRRPNWFEQIGIEHRAVRETVGIIDQSSFAKFILEGESALAILDLLCTNQMDRPVGSVIYTMMLNFKGGIECDVTVTRLAEQRFLIVAGTGYASHHYYHIANRIPKNCSDVNFTDVTDKYTTLSISGPNSRQLLQPVIDCDLSSVEFPFLKAKNVRICGLDAIALRVSFAGELGWELHIPTLNALRVYRAIAQQGAHNGLRNVGYRALETLRLEKGFRALGSDIGPDYTPLEAGLDKIVRLDSDASYIGHERLKHQSTQPLERYLVCFTLADKDVVLHGRETIYRNDVRVGWTSSAGWGYTVEKNIAYGYIRNSEGTSDEYLFNAEYELEVETVRVPVSIEREYLYDPKSRKLRT